VEAEVSARCHTEAIADTDMAPKHPIIHLPARTHFMGPSSGQVGVVSHGVEDVAEFSVAGEGFVDGGEVEVVACGPSMKLRGSVISKGPTAPPLAFAQLPIPIAQS
jgi:hypothetical protein